MSDQLARQRVAVAGATGYIGGRLVPRLLDEGRHVICLARTPAKLADRTWASHPHVEIRQTDLGEAGTPANIAFRINGPLNRFDRGMAMALNADGEIYLIGVFSATPHAPSPADSLTAKLAVNTFRPAILAAHRYDGGVGLDIPCTLATWQDPDMGRRSVLRDPMLGDLVVVSGQSAQIQPPGNPRNQYFTMMYDSNLVPRWLKVYD